MFAEHGRHVRRTNYRALAQSARSFFDEIYVPSLVLSPKIGIVSQINFWLSSEAEILSQIRFGLYPQELRSFPPQILFFLWALFPTTEILSQIPLGLYPQQLRSSSRLNHLLRALSPTTKILSQIESFT